MELINYLKGVKKEFQRVKWPSKTTTIYFTIGVIFLSAFFGFYIFFLDLGFLEILKKFVN